MPLWHYPCPMRLPPLPFTIPWAIIITRSHLSSGGGITTGSTGAICCGSPCHSSIRCPALVSITRVVALCQIREECYNVLRRVQGGCNSACRQSKGRMRTNRAKCLGWWGLHERVAKEGMSSESAHVDESSKTCTVLGLVSEGCNAGRQNQRWLKTRKTSSVLRVACWGVTKNGAPNVLNATNFCGRVVALRVAKMGCRIL